MIFLCTQNGHGGNTRLHAGLFVGASRGISFLYGSSQSSFQDSTTRQHTSHGMTMVKKEGKEIAHTLHQDAQTDSDRSLKIVRIRISLRINQLQFWPRLRFRLRARFKRDHSLNTTTLHPPTNSRARFSSVVCAPERVIVPTRRTCHHALVLSATMTGRVPSGW